MGECQGWLFEPTFNRSIKLRRGDARITSDAGALLLREADHRLGLTADLAARLTDPRDPRHIRYSSSELLRQHLYASALGYAHQDDHDALAHDVAMKMSVWDPRAPRGRQGPRVVDERLASQPSDWRLIERLSDKSNRRALREALAWWVGRYQRAAGQGCTVSHGTIDIDPFPIEVHGNQEGGAYHGYYRESMYYPLVASFSARGSYESARLGEGFVHAILRKGNAGGAEGMPRFVREAIRKSRDLARNLDVRIDAGLVEGKVLDAIADEGVRFVGRIKNNAVLDDLARPHLQRDPGRPTKEGDEFAIELGEYRAASWTRSYRLVLVVIDPPDPKTGFRNLFPHHFFLVTNWPASQHRGRGAWDLLGHYRRRGTFEDRLGEFNACMGGGLSQGAFAANETSLLLKLLAFNLAGMLRAELEDTSSAGWDLKRVQRTVLKAGARVVEHGRRLIVDVAAAAAVLWDRLLGRVRRWWRDESWGRGGGGNRGDRGARPRGWVAPPPHAHLSLVLRE